MSDASPTILTVHHFSYSTPTEDAWLTHADNKLDVFHIKHCRWPKPLIKCCRNALLPSQR